MHAPQLHQCCGVAAGEAHPHGPVVYNLAGDVPGEIQEGARRVRVGPFLDLVEAELEHAGVEGSPS